MPNATSLPTGGTTSSDFKSSDVKSSDVKSSHVKSRSSHQLKNPFKHGDAQSGEMSMATDGSFIHAATDGRLGAHGSTHRRKHSARTGRRAEEMSSGGERLGGERLGGERLGGERLGGERPYTPEAHTVHAILLPCARHALTQKCTSRLVHCGCGVIPGA